jgi:hypothetical protein
MSSSGKEEVHGLVLLLLSNLPTEPEGKIRLVFCAFRSSCSSCSSCLVFPLSLDLFIAVSSSCPILVSVLSIAISRPREEEPQADSSTEHFPYVLK